jgi:hypothetical protein
MTKTRYFMPTYGAETCTWTWIKADTGTLIAAKMRFLSIEEKSKTE